MSGNSSGLGCDEFVRFRLKVKIDCFADILERLFSGLALRPATLQRRNMSHEITILARFDDDFDVHDPRLTPNRDS